MEPIIRLLIVDDHAIVREGLRAVFSMEKDMQIVGEAEDGVDAVEAAKTLQPDVTLMDLLMPRKGGIEAMAEILEQNPRAHILVLTSFAEVDKIIAAIKLGALGYVVKNSNPKDLIQAVRDVARGAVYLAPEISRHLFYTLNQTEASSPSPAVEQLSPRETEILKLVAQGFTNEEIGRRLFISGRTVGVHVTHILEKMNLSNRTQAALHALRIGLVSLYPEKMVGLDSNPCSEIRNPGGT